MRTMVHDRLFFGDESECVCTDDPTLAVVHACKEPCHRRSVGYTTRTIPRDHPHYLVFERGHHIYLNLIDPDQPLFMMPSFVAFIRFVDREITERIVLIHCNQGESRAPSLALLYMAKRLVLIPNDSYEAAAKAFGTRFTYNPSRGIRTWLANHWHEIT